MDKELEKRIFNFNKDLTALLGKYELGIGAMPIIQKNGTIASNIIIFDANKKEVENKLEKL